MHNIWTEHKIAKRKWKFRWSYITHKKPKKFHSRIRANQYAIKRNSDQYDLIMKGKYG